MIRTLGALDVDLDALALVVFVIARLERVASVGDEVHDDLLDLLSAAADQREVGLDVDEDLDVIATQDRMDE
jgi:hypothetical protein